MLRLAPILAIVTLLSPGIQTTSTPAPSTWQTLAESNEWGTGGSVVDLTDVVPQFRTHEEAQGSTPALPLDTTGWTTVTLSACTESALESAVSGIAAEERIIDASDCSSIAMSGLSGDLLFNFNPGKDKVVLRGNATTRTKLVYTHDGSLPPTAGLNLRMMQITGLSDPTFLGTWNLDRGATLNSQVIGTDETVTELYEGDIIWIQEPSGFAFYGSDASGPTEIRFVRRVLCARWSGVNHGSDCTGVSANGDIRLDRPLTMELDSGGRYDFSDQFTAFEIKHAERKGGGTTTDNVREYLGIENIEIEHSHPYAVRADRPALRFQNASYFWAKNIKIGGWGQSRIDFGSSTVHTGPGLITQSHLYDEVWDITCMASVNSLATTNPVQLTIASDASCNDWGGAGEPIWFPDDYPIAALRGTHAYTIVSPETGGVVVISLDGIDGAGMSTNPGGWGVPLKFFSDATVYMRTGTSGVEFADVIFENTRIGILMQGAMETVIGFSDFWTDAETGYNRGIFDHSGWGNFLVEGVRSNAQWLTLMATAPAAGPGEGPHQTVVNSHFVDDGTSTTSAYGKAGYGGGSPGFWFDETGTTSRAGRQNYGLTAFGTVFGGVNTTIDTCDQPGSTSGCADNQASGIYLRSYVHETGNLWLTDVDVRLAPYGVGASANLSTVSPESEAGDANEGTELSVGNRGREYPTSISRTVVPSWWCTQSGTFPAIGSKFRDAEDTPHPNLPAQIRRLGNPCTHP